LRVPRLSAANSRHVLRTIIDANLFVGVLPNRKASWLQSFEPTGHRVYSYLIFDISPVNLASQRVPPR
jgi:hypothetical protein